MALTTFKNDMRITGDLYVTGKIKGDGTITPGVGISGAAETFKAWTEDQGEIIKTSILIDLTGLSCGGTAGDIIGANGAGVAYLGQVVAATSGTIFSGRMTCLETPTNGDTDIDLYSATEATGVEDTAISTLTETQLIDAGASSLGSQDAFTAWPVANSYLYLVGQGTGNAAYTAGRLLIEMWGHRL
jgi:hypothetical protein